MYAEAYVEPYVEHLHWSLRPRDVDFFWITVFLDN